MKKLFTLFALLTCFMGANAKEIVDAEVDFSKYTDISQVKWAGWGASESALARLSIVDGCLHFHSEEATDPSWDCQFHPIGFGSNAEIDVTYTLHFKIKGSVAQNVSMLGFGLTPYGQFPITTDWVEGTVDYKATGTSGDILMQCGDYVGDWDIAYLKITHEGSEERPAVWQQWLTNDGKSIIPGTETTSKYVGDAETAWPSWSLETTDGINANWRGDRTGEICAWALTMGKNNDSGVYDGSELDGRARPFPADIEVEAGNESNHVYAVHVDQIAKIDDDASIQWSNQFWIQSPQPWKEGAQIKIKFRYKAAKAAKAATQIHKQHPSDYLHWEAIGDVNFTTEWQEFDSTITFNGSQATGWSLCFNLCADSSVDAPQEPNVFYFDDLSWETMVLDEGLYVASSNSSTGIEYDFDNATEFVYDESDDAYVATVGTAGKKDTWVDEVMISTIRGNNQAFKSATIKPSNLNASIGEDMWGQYSSASAAKIKLPAAGVWKISLAPTEEDITSGEINFIKIEGEEDKDPIDVVTNKTAIVVHGLERDDLSDTAQGDNPQREEEGGTGETWDNQFFFKANRALEKGEVTVLKFKYKSSVADANTTTQCHGETPGAYMHWAAIGNVTFGTEWQDFSQEFTVPSEADGMWCIAFNMAEIKAACDYEITDVQWYLKDESLDEGKTWENLIDAEGSNNFYVKEGAGTNPYVYGTPAGITNVMTTINGNAAIYNLAGQKVGKDYKGLVIKNGKKFVNK